MPPIFWARQTCGVSTSADVRRKKVNSFVDFIVGRRGAGQQALAQGCDESANRSTRIDKRGSHLLSKYGVCVLRRKHNEGYRIIRGVSQSSCTSSRPEPRAGATSSTATSKRLAARARRALSIELTDMTSALASSTLDTARSTFWSEPTCRIRGARLLIAVPHGGTGHCICHAISGHSKKVVRRDLPNANLD